MPVYTKVYFTPSVAFVAGLREKRKNSLSILVPRTTSPILNQFTSGLLHTVYGWNRKLHFAMDIGYCPLISWPPTNQLTSQVKITLQQLAPSSHEHAELQALQLGNHKNVWS